MYPDSRSPLNAHSFSVKVGDRLMVDDHEVEATKITRKSRAQGGWAADEMVMTRCQGGQESTYTGNEMFHLLARKRATHLSHAPLFLGGIKACEDWPCSHRPRTGTLNDPRGPWVRPDQPSTRGEKTSGERG